MTLPDALEGRLANASAALVVGEGTNALAQALESLFEDVVVVAGAAAEEQPGEGALGELVRALSAAREDRVLVVAADAPHATPIRRGSGGCSKWQERGLSTSRETT